MKKILVGIITLSLLFVNTTFGYEYTQADTKTLNSAYAKIDTIFEKSPRKIKQLEKIIDSYVIKLESDTQMYFLLIALKSHINELQTEFQNEQNTVKMQLQKDEEQKRKTEVETKKKINEKPAPKVNKTPNKASNVNTGTSNGNTFREYLSGKRGGCYYLNNSGNKTYVDRSFCRKK